MAKQSDRVRDVEKAGDTGIDQTVCDLRRSEREADCSPATVDRAAGLGTAVAEEGRTDEESKRAELLRREAASDTRV